MKIPAEITAIIEKNQKLQGALFSATRIGFFNIHTSE
jgi:hypothetical protein